MAETLALNPFVIVSPVSNVRHAVARLNVLLESQVFILQSRISSENAAAVATKALRAIATQYMRYRHANSENQRTALTIYVVENDSEVVDSVLAEYKKRGPLKNKEISQITADTNNQLNDNPNGLHNAELNIVLIHLGNIKNQNKEKRFMESCFFQTVVHETLHSKGQLPNYADYDLRWLNEAVTEILTIELIEKTPELNALMKGVWTESYANLKPLARYLINFVGNDAVCAAFFSRSMDPIIDELKSLGLNKSQINKIFNIAYGIFTSGARDYKEFSDYMKYLEGVAAPKKEERKKLVELVPVAREAMNATNSYISPVRDALKLPQREMRVRLEEIVRSEYKESYETARLGSIRHAVQSSGGFREENLAWLNGAITQRLSMSIMRKYFHNELAEIGQKEMARSFFFNKAGEHLV